MSMLERYKKKGEAGLMELVKLVETSPEAKQSQLMNMVRSESEDYANQVQSRILSFEVIQKLPENILAEIMTTTPVKFVALSLHQEDETFTKLVEKCLGKSFNEYKSEKESFAQNPPSPAQIDAAKKKIITETRKLEAAGRLKLPAIGTSPLTETSKPEASTPSENKAPIAREGTGKPQESSSSNTGGASSGDPCPSIASFGIEPPVPGLMSERFEAFLKGRLGIK